LSNLSAQKIFFALIALTCFFLLFWGGPNYHSPRSFQNAWQLGHILFFFIVTYLLIKSSKTISNLPFITQSLLLIILTLFVGVVIEFFQTVIDDRQPDIKDLIRNIIGCLLALTFFSPSRSKIRKIRLRVVQIGTIILIILEIIPAAIGMIDEITAYKQLPILADFETPFEIERFSGDAGFTTDNTVARHGNRSLKVWFGTNLYSGVALKYFPSDWKNFSHLKFSIYNPSSDPLNVISRLHDADHYDKGGSFDDRFNVKTEILQGWNDIEIALEDVENAPKTRKMNLNHIQGLSVYTVQLPQERIIYIDYIRLVKRKSIVW